MTMYIEILPGMNRSDVLAPVKILSVTHDTATVEVTKTVRCYRKGQTMTVPRDAVVEKCGRQRGRYVGFTFGHNFNRNDIYVRPARLPYVAK